MGINNLLTKIKIYYKILYCILMLFYQKRLRKLITLKVKIKIIPVTVETLSKIINK